MDTVATKDFPFVQELPKRERSKLANLWETLKELRVAFHAHGSVVPQVFAAELLGVSRQRVHQMLESGQLESVTVRGLRYVTEDSLVARAQAEKNTGGRPKAPSLKTCIAVGCDFVAQASK